MNAAVGSCAGARTRREAGPTVTFSFEGRRLTACQGDTVAAALLANGVHVFGPQLQVPPAARVPLRSRSLLLLLHAHRRSARRTELRD